MVPGPVNIRWGPGPVKYKLGARADKYNLGPRARKYKLWARARAGGRETQTPGKHPENTRIKGFSQINKIKFFKSIKYI